MYDSEGFAYIILFNPHKNFMHLLLLFPLDRWEKEITD